MQIRIIFESHFIQIFKYSNIRAHHCEAGLLSLYIYLFLIGDVTPYCNVYPLLYSAHSHVQCTHVTVLQACDSVTPLLVESVSPSLRPAVACQVYYCSCTTVLLYCCISVYYCTTVPSFPTSS